jgi:hypothetical protein
MQYELNDGLAEHLHKKGGPGTNPHGVQGSRALRAWRREFKDELEHVSREACTLHERPEPISHSECLARRLWISALLGERWACHLLLLRWQGRVPYSVDLQTHVTTDWTQLFDDTARLRYRALIDREAQATITPDEADEQEAFRMRSGAPTPQQLTRGHDNGLERVE